MLCLCPIICQKREVHETDDESEDKDDKSEDNSDFRVVAASLTQKKKSGTTSVKEHYVQGLPRHVSVSSFKQPPSNEQKTLWRLCCTSGGPAESNKAV